MRDVRYQRGTTPEGAPAGISSDLSGTHQYLSKPTPLSRAVSIWTQPLIKSEAHETKAQSRERSSRRASPRVQRTPLSAQEGSPARRLVQRTEVLSRLGHWAGGCPNHLFRPELIRPDGLTLDETTQSLDKYHTGLDVHAVYAMLDAKLLPKLRAVGAGIRTEITYQSFHGYDPSRS